MANVEDQDERLSKIDQLRWEVGKLQNRSEQLTKSDEAMVLQDSEIQNQFDSQLEQMRMQSQLLETMTETSRQLGPANHELHAAEKSSATTSDTANQVIAHSSDTPTEFQLGYRGISGALPNRERIWYKVDMPVFNGSSPFGWMARVERYFRLGNYSDEQKLNLASVHLAGPGLSWFNWEIEHELFRDWADFKQRMLDRFAESWYAESGKRLCCIQQTEMKEVVFKKEQVPVPEISPVTALMCSSPKVLLQHVSNPEVVQEASSTGAKELIETSLIYEKENLWNKTIPVMEHEEDANVIPVSHVKELDELSLGLQVPLVFKKESVPASVHEKDWVQQVDSPTVEDFPDTYGDCDSVMMPDGPVVFKGVPLPPYPFSCHGFFVHKEAPMRFLFVEEAISVFQSLVGIHVHCCVLYEHEEILSTTKKLKCCKSWHFKYKTKLRGRNSAATMQFVSSRRLVVRTDYKAEIYVLRMRLIGQSLKSSSLTNVEFQVKHKWRYKLLQQFLELEMNLDCVVILFADATCWLYVDKGWTFTLSSAYSGWEQLRDEVKWVQFKNENKFRQAFLVHIFGDESVDKAATRMEKLQQWLLQSSLPQIHHRLTKQKFLKAWHFKYRLHGIANPIRELTQNSMMLLVLEKDRVLIMLQLQGNLQKVAHTMQKVYLAHTARTLQAISGLLLRHWVGSTEAAATENSSQPSALVQKFAARLLWLLLNGINIEIDINTEILAVLEPIIQHYNALLILLKSNLLQIQVHKSLKQRKFTKTWMFKYKESNRHVHFLIFTSTACVVARSFLVVLLVILFIVMTHKY